MVEPLSVAEAARILNLSPARVRAMAVHGQLPAAKLGDRWFVERAAVERRRRNGALDGRRYSAHNAWALLLLASHEEVAELDPSVRSRLKRALRQEGISKLAPRLERRAEALSFVAHPSEISYLLGDRRLLRSGISAAGDQGFNLISGQEADGYVQAAEFDEFVADHALQPAGSEGNVRLRILPEAAYPFIGDRETAPRAAVAVDLADDLDPRSAQAGRKELRELDHLWSN